MSGGRGAPWFPCEDVISLWIIPQAGRELRPAAQREAGVTLGLLDEDCGLLCRSGGAGSLRLGHSARLVFSRRQATHDFGSEL